ncbi:MAG: serine--tRNA ligase [Deinococcota bacterium]
MLDLKTIRDNRERVRSAIRQKQLGDAASKLDELLLLDEENRLLRGDLETKQAERNASSKRIGELKRKGENADELIRSMGQLSDEVKRLEERARTLGERMDQLILEIPNPPHESVPYGETEHDNVIVYERGDKPSFDFEAKPHWELANARGWIDLEAGVTLIGSGFPVFKGVGARFLRALRNYQLDALGEAGYTEIAPPLMVNEASAIGTANLPDKEGQMYTVSDGFYLIPTSETAITNLHRGEILDEASLPICYTAYTPCFRREAGSYGKDVRGINRVHQFDKAEIVQFVKPEDSYDVLETMTSMVESTLDKLGLPYRRLLMCTGDMGFAQAKKYDIEVWSAGQERWLEVSSISNFESFQARRLQTRFRPGGAGGRGKPELVHTLNGSHFGMVRLYAAILENFQQEDGTVALPEVLHEYMGRSVLE